MVEGDPVQCIEDVCERMKFAAPKGIAALNGEAHGGLTKGDIVARSDAHPRGRLVVVYEYDKDSTNDDSPSVADCEQIIRNIQGDINTNWTQEVVDKPWRDLKANGCKFSFRASKSRGNSAFYVGGQNVIDLIEKSVEDYAKNGKVSASGHMTCGGTAVKQWTEWKLQKN
ncbi:hypothetical protein GGTG_07428 [Gaeumannomyces tritici R3-111a-1]|uniref:Ecp2 effector protein-like domain-containing protein n=1 Tax=Gaeumannomyces tritici (strain R3-111a-1) TaxID=644352 RepID=J3P1N0_GAET3|nr:hypothetical protein GGTG_07428 [Gaeumannomyces tritici R3-111a-1]EJT73572.1 hypothetical protein GGTG_07428 [Gaeumannomyces tritici R3-111a-1]